MADRDISQYSDEELQGMLKAHEQQQQQPNISQVPTEELERMYSAAAPQAQSDNDYYGPYLGWMSALGSGMAKGAAALPGLPGTVGSLLQAGSKKAGEALGYTPPERSMADRLLSYLPTSEQTTEAAKPYVPALQQEATTPGQKIAETVGEFAVTPGPAGKEKTATRALDEASNLAKQFTKEAVVPGAASSIAGQATEGTDLEPFARIAGAIAPSGLVGATRAAGRAILPDAAKMEETLATAQRAGVDLPSFVAAESKTPKMFAAGAKAMPLGNIPINQATQKALEQTGEAASKIYTDLGAATPEMAGTGIEQGINNWIRGKSAVQLDAAFKNLNDVVPVSSQTQLNNLRSTVDRITSQRTAARLNNVQSGATKIVENALADTSPMTFEGARNLRTEIGNNLSNLYRLPGDVNAGELKKLYGALTKDLEEAARTAGGAEGVRSFREANKMTETIRNQQKSIAKIVGLREGTYSPEQILGNLERLAASGTKGNIERLMLARRSMPIHDWENVTSSIVGKLGRDAEGNFSPDRFITGYSKFSPHGKDIIFGPPTHDTRKAIEDLAAVSSKLKDAGKFANTSNTANVIKASETIAGLFFAPFKVLPAIAANYGVAKALASPKTAKYAAGLARAVERASRENPTIPVIQNAAVKSAYSAYLNAIQNAHLDERPERANGGRIGKGDYPAKRLTLAAKRAHKEIADEFRPLMDMPDEHIAEALHRARDK